MAIYAKNGITIASKEEVEKIIAGAIKTAPVITTANQPAIVPTIETPVFEKMTKIEIVEWASANIGIELNRKDTKAIMIETLKKHL